LPPFQGRPDQGLPGDQPGIDNTLPGSQPRPDQGLPGAQPGIDNTLPQPPPQISNPIYDTYWMLCYTPNHGWKYVAVDPSLTVGYPLPDTEPTPTPHRRRQHAR
jgi:hypothetical protein